MQLDAGCRHRSGASVRPRQHTYTGSQIQLLFWSQTTSISVRMIQLVFFLKLGKITEGQLGSFYSNLSNLGF